MNSQGKPVVTVSQVNRLAAMLFKNEQRLADVYVKGEISNFTNHYKSGHLYFSLKDNISAIKAVMFAGNAKGLRYELYDGLSVIVRGSVQVYEQGGIYQLYTAEIVPEGIGEAQLALEQLKERLLAEGVFSQKRALPAKPEKICLVTAETGAALQDMLNIFTRRYPVVKIVLIPALVQGESAPRSVAKAIAAAQKTDSDLIIIARGGGSAEDLSAFNTEEVVRAVFASKIPTISGVGHETDTTLCDYAADLRAPTPSAAAELAVPDIAEVYAYLGDMKLAFRRHIESELDKRLNLLQRRELAVKAFSPVARLASAEQKISAFERWSADFIENVISRKAARLSAAAGVVAALNPLEVLSRGYSATYKNGMPVREAKRLSVGDSVDIMLGKGFVKAEVTAVFQEEKNDEL